MEVKYPKGADTDDQLRQIPDKPGQQRQISLPLLF
jgi:hypothetical protein